MTGLSPISSLLSPPQLEMLCDFGPPTKRLCTSSSRSDHDYCDMHIAEHSPAMKRIMPPISPPVSPQNALQKKVEGQAPNQDLLEARVADPILFPEHASIHASQPPGNLFTASKEDNVYGVIERHIASRGLPSKSSNLLSSYLGMPTVSDYKLALSCVPTVTSIYNSRPAGYARRLCHEAMRDFELVKGTHRSPALVHKGAMVSSSLPKSQSLKAVSRHTLPRTRNPLLPKKATLSRTHSARPFTIGRGATPDGKLAGKRVEDTEFGILPDFSPPTTTLRSGTTLRTDWTGSAVDLSKDPHRHLLHDAELAVASTLRLSCATYLCSKRRIFMARLENYKQGREFRKTDAQQACKIDVNKASKLWTAYDKAGWFARENFDKWL